MRLHGESLVAGNTSGKILHSNIPLSFWGGIDPGTGIVIDKHHPLCGHSVSGSILALPSGRGSCSGSMLMLELLLGGRAPTALILGHKDEILALGVLVAQTVFQISIPVLVLSTQDFLSLGEIDFAFVYGNTISSAPASEDPSPIQPVLTSPRTNHIVLSARDEALRRGDEGPARKLAMEIIIDFAALQGSKKLIDMSRAHIDSCHYTGPASLAFPEKLSLLGGHVAIPTTMNAISIDTRRWRELGVDSTEAAKAEKLARMYVSMGAQSTFTCAPYNLTNPPSSGEQLGWGESNAVIFANSVLGARTQKYPDLLEVCVALTGRAPLAGCHTNEGRQPQVRIVLPTISNVDDAIYAALGYLTGSAAASQIPIVYGLEHLEPSLSDLKGFAAAFGTSSSAPMFHIMGVTPEARQHSKTADSIPVVRLDEKALRNTIQSLNTAHDDSVGLVSLGNPHFSLEEFKSLAKLCAHQKIDPSTSMIVTTSQDTLTKANTAGWTPFVEAFGAQIITDTCWCMITEPIIPPAANIMTNSAKYAHYAPGLVKRGVHFASLAECVEAARRGRFERQEAMD